MNEKEFKEWSRRNPGLMRPDLGEDMDVISAGQTLHCLACLSNETIETGTGTETGARHTTIRCLVCYKESKVRTQEIRGVVYGPRFREDCNWCFGEIDA